MSGAAIDTMQLVCGLTSILQEELLVNVLGGCTRGVQSTDVGSIAWIPAAGSLRTEFAKYPTEANVVDQPAELTAAQQLAVQFIKPDALTELPHLVERNYASHGSHPVTPTGATVSSFAGQNNT